MANAMAQIQICLVKVGDAPTATPGKRDLKEEYRKYAHHPHLHHTLVELKHAHKHLKSAKHDFGGNRQAAMRDIEQAIQEVSVLLKFVKKWDERRVTPISPCHNARGQNAGTNAKGQRDCARKNRNEANGSGETRLANNLPIFYKYHPVKEPTSLAGIFPDSSMVEQPAVNRFVVGSSPTRGASISCCVLHSVRTLSHNLVIHNAFQRILRNGARRHGCLLHRILHHNCTGFCTAFCRPLEVFLPCLQVMLLSDRWCIPQPGRDDVKRKFRRQLGFAGSPQIVEELRPGNTPARLMILINSVRKFTLASRYLVMTNSAPSSARSKCFFQEKAATPGRWEPIGHRRLPGALVSENAQGNGPSPS